jgi:hypothetical protein
MPDDRHAPGASLAERQEVNRGEEVDTFHARSLWAFIFLIGGILWLSPIASSLWLDELVTWWVVKDSLAETFHRAYIYQGQSVIYYPLEWAVRHVGHSEWFLRLPSLLAMTIAAFVLYRLTRRLADRGTARIAILVFVLWPDVVFEASNARPYALATLATVVSTWALVRWLDRGTTSSSALYVLLGAAVAYAHILFALVLPCHILYALMRSREETAPTQLWRIVGVFGAIGLLDLALIVQLVQLASRRASLTLPSILSIEWLASLLVPAAVVVGVVLGGIMAWWAGYRLSVRPVSVDRSTTVLITSGMLIPVLVLAGLAVFTPLKLVETRYTMAAAPFGAVFCAGVIRALHPYRLRWFVCITLALFSLVALKSTSKRGDDWRWGSEQADRLASPETAVLIRPGLVESADVSWFDDPERASYLMAPTSYYSFVGMVEPIPFDQTSSTATFLVSELDALPPTVDRIVVVNGARGGTIDSYLAGRLEATGWVLEAAAMHEEMAVAEWVRAPT